MHIKFQNDSIVSATNDQGKDYISNHWTKLRDQCFMEFALSNLVILYLTVILSIPVMIGLLFRQEKLEDTKGIIKAVN